MRLVVERTRHKGRHRKQPRCPRRNAFPRHPADRHELGSDPVRVQRWHTETHESYTLLVASVTIDVRPLPPNVRLTASAITLLRAQAVAGTAHSRQSAYLTASRHWDIVNILDLFLRPASTSFNHTDADFDSYLLPGSKGECWCGLGNRRQRTSKRRAFAARDAQTREVVARHTHAQLHYDVNKQEVGQPSFTRKRD